MMKPFHYLVPMLALSVAFGGEIENPSIDFRKFVEKAGSLEPIRESRRVTEAEFLEMAAANGTIILDARTKDKFENIHIRGAVHLALTDFTESALRDVIPDKSTRVLIYCNNNFRNEPVNFASKRFEVALNIQTFINLHAYGYENVYELGPLLDVKTTRIPFEGKSVPKQSPLAE